MSKSVVIVEPFYAGSHKTWTDGVEQLFREENHQVHKLTLPGRHWKWRMFGAANYLAEELLSLGIQPDVLLVSDMLDLSVFVGVARKLLTHSKLVVYFHENQLTYPWSPTDEDVRLKRDQSYGLINLRTALIADEVYFNSSYHQTSFLEAVKGFIKQFPDATKKSWITSIQEKSKVLYLGMNLESLIKQQKPASPVSVILWNHRWEYDKNPEEFYDALKQLKQEQIDFQLIVCGEKNKKYPEVFDKIEKDFAEELIHFGFAADRTHYYDLLNQATVLPVTSFQDFFGGSVVEAIAAGCVPVLPNRLAYPEHLPEELRNKYVANTNQEWFTLLKEVVGNPAYFKSDLAEMRSFVKRYDWGELKSQYLQMLK